MYGIRLEISKDSSISYREMERLTLFLENHAQQNILIGFENYHLMQQRIYDDIRIIALGHDADLVDNGDDTFEIHYDLCPTKHNFAKHRWVSDDNGEFCIYCGKRKPLDVYMTDGNGKVYPLKLDT